MIGVTIDGRNAAMVLDTGASGPALMPDAPKRLTLPIDTQHPPERMTSYGRPFDVWFARVRWISFAGIRTAVEDLPVVAGGSTQAGVDGFFVDPRLYQAELDLGRGRVRLGCAGGRPGWTHRAGVFSVALEDRQRLFGTALIADRPVRVLFDTGSPGSSLTLAAASRVGLHVAGPPDAEAAGLGMTVPLRAWTARLPSISLGGDVTADVPMLVVDKPNASADMIAGFDFFVRNRVWIDRAGGRMMYQARRSRRPLNGDATKRCKAAADCPIFH